MVYNYGSVIDTTNSKGVKVLENSTLDARGIPTRVCPSCNGDLFTVQVSFDEGYDVAGYLLDCECAYCHTKLTAPTPLDLVIDNE